MGSGPQDNILAAQSDEFADSQSSLHRHQQESVIPATRPGSLIGCRDKGIDFGSGQKVHRFGLVAFTRDSQDALSQGTQARLLERHVVEE